MHEFSIFDEKNIWGYFLSLEVRLHKEISTYSFIVIKLKCKTEEQMEIVTISENKWNKVMPMK